MRYFEWDYDWRDTRTGKTGTYRAGSSGLQTEADVKRFVETCLTHVEFIGCRLVGEGEPKVTTAGAVPLQPISPDHVLHTSVAERNKMVRDYLKK